MATRISQIAFVASMVLGVVLSAGVSVHAQTILYVDQSASGPTHDGSSWCNAYLEVHEALDVATSGAVIRVADGTYLPDTAGLPDPREATFGLLDGVALEGGYAGCGAADPDQRDIALYETILSGDIGVSGQESDNCYHVVTGSGTDQTAVLEGFTISAGHADGADPHSNGAGLYNSTGSPTVTDCTFSGNFAVEGGGGMYNYDNASPTVTNCTFRENTADHGGGMSNIENSSPRIANCTFSGNNAGHGGGMYTTYDSDPTVTNCTFNGNNAGVGGGMYNDYVSDPTVTNCILWANSDVNGTDEPAQIAGDPVINYCCVQGWTGGLGGTGNIGDDPGFAFPDDVHLMAGSPCIDTGTNSPAGGLPASDPDGNTRPLDGDGIGGAVADMGAYEFNRQTPSIAVSPPNMELFALEGSANPDDQALSIRNCGGGTLSWEVAENCSWVQAAPAGGDSGGEVDDVTVGVNIAGLAHGEHKCALTVSDAQGVNTPRVVTIVLYVGTTLNVPGEYGTIQAAIDASVHGDVVLVADKVYTGIGNKDLDFGGRRIAVRSENGPANCIIDCEGDGRGFHFHSGEQATSVVDGFTITRGFFGAGGGIRCNTVSSPAITNCAFSANSANNGGGIFNYIASNPTVTNCTFSGNSAYDRGGAMYNSERSRPTVTNCTFNGNSASSGGGIRNYRSSTTVTNCILWGNTDDGGTDQTAQIFGGPPVVNYSCVQGWTGGLGGTGNIGADPDFAFSDDPHLIAGSPCIDTGTNSPPGGLPPPPTDLDGNARPLDGDGIGGAVADMGAYEFNPETPSIAVSPPAMEFLALGGGANPVPQTLSIRNCGGGTLNWEVTEDCSWLQAAPASGDSAGEVDDVTISVNVAGLAQCEHRCALTVSDTQAVNTPREVAVVLRFPVLYVDDDASTGGDGQAWATAYKYLQDALWEAGTSGAISEIRIAQGTYKPDQDEGGHFTPGDRAAAFGLMSGVALMGGYAGIGAPDPDARDIEAYETIFSGDLAGDDGPDFANNGENSYHVVTGGVIDATAVLDGVTITAGNGTQGGGVYLVGVDSSLSSDPTLVNCTVCANQADTGGGMYSYRSAASLTGCTLSGNSASEGGGFAAISGSYVIGPTFLGCTISGNSASSEGGGGYVAFEVVLEMQDCTLSDNSAGGDGGGLHLSQDTNAYDVINCVLRKNSAGGDGGAVYSNAWFGGFAGFTNCVFSGNQASGDGGAYRDPGYSSHQGFARCTFNGNTAIHGGAISVDGDDSYVSVNNCIVWDNGGGELDIGPYTGVTMNYSDVDHYLSGTGTGNIREDPRFVDANGPDGIYGTEDDNLRLQSASPCINTGDPGFVPDPGQTDLDGHSRVLCGRLDMGAYEFGIGDYECDFDVDLDDFGYWDDCMTGPDAGPYDPGCEAFDFEFDDDVDLDDFRRFQQVFEGG